ncbi:MAG: dienelactone hydrolase [Deltaproteobacteria bacterium]|nr:dienelactone hydrolase [Deltaproteobacteria bacterium]
MFVTFPAGDLTLEGELALPAGAIRAAVVCHPHPQFGGDMDNPVVRAVAGALKRAGYATLRFNFRGVGRSRKTYEQDRGEVEDVRAAVGCVMQHTHASSVTLAGYSFGAVMALHVGIQRPEVAGLIAVALPLVALDDFNALFCCRTAKLFIVGDRDQFCDLAGLQQQFARLAEPKMLQVIAGADHFLVGHEAAVAKGVARFASAETAAR